VKKSEKGRCGWIHHIFLLFDHVSIAGISNHHEALLARFWFDVYSPRYLHEQKVPDFKGVDTFMQKDNFMHYCTVGYRLSSL
jgi:hypothetical protein